MFQQGIAVRHAQLKNKTAIKAGVYALPGARGEINALIERFQDEDQDQTQSRQIAVRISGRRKIGR
jgi:hypothetical protein